ncbi:MAG: hypothetical protein RL095_157 [Verrucomicrobiota bacterium]|jgi:arylsulfatase A-like enzyme
MKKLIILGLAWLASLAACTAALAPQASADSAPEAPAPAALTRPNILFIFTDQQTIGALSCAGNPYLHTPAMDSLAARGMRFEKSYCTYPLCAPSRGSLFTSRTPHELGIYENDDAELASKKFLNAQTMGEIFQAAGYETAYAGKWHLNAPWPGFGSGHKIPGFATLPLVSGKNISKIDKKKEAKGLTADPSIADASIAFLRQKHDKPFLLVTSILNPHDICEYSSCEALQALVPSDPSKLPPARPNMHDTETLPSALQNFTQSYVTEKKDWTELQWRQYLYAYYRLVEASDREVGRVLAALQESAAASNTIIVFTSDHGEMMGSHQMCRKQRLYEEAVAVPLVVVLPDGKKAWVNKRHLVSGLDIMPTFLDYAGIAIPPSLGGRSLRPLVEGQEVPWRDFVVSELNGAAEARMVRSARYKYIVFATGENREQFFDLEKDPGELKNLIAEPSLAAEIEKHRKMLVQWRLDTHDEIGKRAPGKGKKGKEEE